MAAPASPPARVSIWTDSYRPTSHQRRFHGSAARYRAIVAGRRAGKTLASAADLVARAYLDYARKQHRAVVTDRSRTRRPALHYWIVAPTYKLLAEPLRCLHDVTSPALIDEWRADSNPPHVWLRGGILIEGWGAEHPERLVSVGLDGVWLDEAAAMKQDVWLGRLRPTLTERRGWAIFSTTPQGENWFHEHVWKACETAHDDHAGFHWTTADNTAVPGIVEEVARARRDLPQKYFRREYEASFEAFIGQIFDMFEPTRHVLVGPRPSPGRYRSVVAGVDWGYVDPGAVVIVGITGDGRFDVLAEEYAPRRPTPAWVEVYRRIKAEWRVRVYYCDPSRPDMLTELRRAASGVDADNDVLGGLQAVATLFHTGRLRIHESCTHLLRTLRSYRWREHPQHGTVEEPAPGQEDHLIDALRYALYAETRPATLRAL